MLSKQWRRIFYGQGSKSDWLLWQTQRDDQLCRLWMMQVLRLVSLTRYKCSSKFMPLLIYIRHAHDEYPDATYRDDRRITMRGWKEAYRLGKYLIHKYGIPTRVYSGPLTRTLQTTVALMRTLEDSKIRIDKRLSRYFSPYEQELPDLSLRNKRRTPIVESSRQFRKRVGEHLDRVIRDEGVIWCITHSVVLRELTRLGVINAPDTVPFLGFYVAQL